MALADALNRTTPRDSDLGLKRVSAAGLVASVLPTGSLFALEHESQDRRIMINQVLGSPINSGIARLYVRMGGPNPSIRKAISPGAGVHFGVGDDRILWKHEADGIDRSVTLWLAP